MLYSLVFFVAVSLLSVFFSTAFAVSGQAPTTAEYLETDSVLSAPAGHQSTYSQPPTVDIAILLDTSNSMDGLIDQAKSQLWTIVQQFAKAKKYDRSPALRVALFEYGNSNQPVTEGYLRQVVPLSNDLDLLSESLFSLRTDGGDEYCGQVIDEAISRLDWSSAPGSYQAVFIAGNEPFTQGAVDYHFAIGRASERGIIVNTIHCGDEQAGIEGKWKDGAQLAHGEFFNIDQDQVIVNTPCPQDMEIIRLNDELNNTYLWFGSSEKRQNAMSNQTAQDSNAQSLSTTVAVSRCLTKSGKMYNNCSRDLVDGMEVDSEILEKVSEEELPDKMQKMTKEERINYLNQMATNRASLKKQIGEQSVEREKFLQAEQIRLAEKVGTSTLGSAVVNTIRKQLVDQGFEITGTSNLN